MWSPFLPEHFPFRDSAWRQPAAFMPRLWQHPDSKGIFAPTSSTGLFTQNIQCSHQPGHRDDVPLPGGTSQKSKLALTVNKKQGCT